MHNSFPTISFIFLLLSLYSFFFNTEYHTAHHCLPCRTYLCALYSLFSFLAHSFFSVLHPFSFFKLLRALPFFMLHDFSPFIFARSLLSLSSSFSSLSSAFLPALFSSLARCSSNYLTLPFPFRTACPDSVLGF